MVYSCVNRYVSRTTTVYKNTCPYVIMSVSVFPAPWEMLLPLPRLWHRGNEYDCTTTLCILTVRNETVLKAHTVNGPILSVCLYVNSLCSCIYCTFKPPGNEKKKFIFLSPSFSFELWTSICTSLRAQEDWISHSERRTLKLLFNHFQNRLWDSKWPGARIPCRLVLQGSVICHCTQQGNWL